MTTTTDQILALKRLTDGIIEAVVAAGADGAPGGVLYAALMTVGCSLEQFETIMSTLVRLGKLQKRGQCYFAMTEATP